MTVFPSRLGPKIYLLLLAFLLVLGTATAALMLFGFRRTQDDATEQSRQGLIVQAEQLIRETAEINSFIGQTIVAEAPESGAEAAALIANAPGVPSVLLGQSLTVDSEGQRFEGDPDRVSDVWVPAGVPLDAAARRDLHDSALLDATFAAMIAHMPDAVSMYFTSTSGLTRSYPPIGVSGRAPGLADALDTAGPLRNARRRTVWTPPYEDPAGQGLLITATTPVYDGGEYRGIIGVDLSLQRLIARADTINLRGAPSGFAFLIDRDGNLLDTRSHDIVERELQNPANEQLSRTLIAMRAGAAGVDRASIDGREMFIGYASLGEFGGSLAFAAPVDEVTSQAGEVAAEIRDEGNRTVAITLTTMALLFLGALGLTAWLGRRMLLRPIDALVHGTRMVASGDLDAQIPVSSGDEIGVLGESFNAMTLQLRSSRKRLEEQQQQVQQSEAELTALFAAMTDVVLVIDREGRYIRTAPTNPGLPYRPRFDLVGQRMHDVWPPEEADRFLRLIGVALDTGEAQHIEHLLEGRWLGSVISPMARDRVLTVSRDITARKTAEQALAEREQQYRSVFESSNDAILITDMDNRIIDANPAAVAMHGYTVEEMREMPPGALIYSSSRDGFGEYLALLRAGKVFRGRAREMRRDGSSFPIEALATPITYRGQPHILAVSRDITEQVQAEQLLEQRVKDRTRELSSLLEVSRKAALTLEQGALLELILDEVDHVAPFDRAAFLLRDGPVLTIVAARDRVQARAGGDIGSSFDLSVPALARSWAGLDAGRSFIIDDVQSESPEARAYRESIGMVVDYTDIRSWMAVPLTLKEHAIGMLALSREAPGFYTERHAELAGAIASQAAAALENARLFEQAEGRARELATILEVSRNVAAKLELRPLLGTILDQMHTIAEYDRSAILLKQPDSFLVVDSRAGPGVVDAVGMRIPIDAVLPMWAALERGRSVVIGDVRADDPMAASYRAAAGAALETAFRDVRSWVGVPLMLQGRLVGVLSLSKNEHDFYDDRHARLLMTIANQLAVAIENARLFEQAENRSRELEALLDISHAVASTLDLKRLVGVILDHLRSLVGNDGASVLTLDGDMLTVVDFRQIEGEGLPDQVPIRFRTSDMTGFWEAMERGESVVVDDVRGEGDGPDTFRRIVGALYDTVFLPVHGWLAVPLISQDRLVGQMAVSSRQAGYFTPERVRLVRAVADQAALAVENARLFSEAEQRTREMSALLEVSSSVASTLELRPLLGLILDRVQEVTGYTGSSLWLLEDGVLETVDARAITNAEDKIGMKMALSEIDPLWDLLSSRQPVIIRDMRDEEEPLAGVWRSIIGEEFAASPSQRDTRARLAVSLAIGDRIIGVLTMSHTRPAYFTEKHWDLAQAIADQAAVAIENARLYAQAEDRAREMAALLGVSRNMASTLQLQPLLEVILQQAEIVVPYERSTIMLLEHNALHIEAVRAAEPGGADDLRRQVGTSIPVSATPELWRVLGGGDSVIIADVGSTDEHMAGVYRDEVGPFIGALVGRIRSWLGVPLALKDSVTGILTLASAEPGFFTERHAELATAIATQAAIAVENARLYDEAASRARETSALLDISAAVVSTLEMKPLLNVILDQLQQIIGNTGAAVLLVDDGVLTILDSRSFVGRDATLFLSFTTAQASPFWDLVSRLETVTIDNVHDDSQLARDYRRMLGDNMALPAFDAIHSWMAVPLAVRDRVIGMMTMSHIEPGYFTERHASLARAMATQGAVAIDNARLFDEAAQRARETSALLDISAAVASTLEMAPLLNVILDQLQQIIGNTGSSVVLIEDSVLTIVDSRMMGGQDEALGMTFGVSEALPLWDAISRQETLRMDDARDDSPLALAYRGVLGDAFERPVFQSVRSWMAVPLIARDRVIGMISLSYIEPGYFTDQHARLARAIADQAAIAIENARLYDEAARRARETSALLDISAAVASTLEMRPLVQVILDQLKQIIGNTGSSLVLLQDDDLVFVGDAEAGGRRFRLADALPLWQVLSRSETLLIDDTRADTDMARAYRVLRQRTFGVEANPTVLTLMAVPLAVRDRVIGTVMMSHSEAGYFTDQHAGLARAIADQAALAIENARLYEETQASAREMAALLSADAELFRSLDLDTVLRALVDVTVDSLGADKAILALIQDGVESIRASRNFSQGALDRFAAQIAALPAGAHQDRHAPYLRTVDDVSALPEGVGRAIYQSERVSSYTAVPIVTEHGVLGSLVLAYLDRHVLSDGERRVALALAERAAVAIGNAELYEKAQHAASLEERQRLARELHDSVSQALYGIALGAKTARTLLDRQPEKAAEPVEYVMSLAEAGLAEMRALIFELRPESLELEGLVAGLTKQAAALRARHNVAVDEELCAEPDVALPVKEALARIAQEAMHNTVKHARATHVSLRLFSEAGHVVLEVIDDGKGFDTEQTFAGHLGLRSMRERATKLGGTIEITSAPGEGARVRVRIPEGTRQN